MAAANSSRVSPASSSVRPSQTAAISSPLAMPRRRARVAPRRDVGIELVGAGREALGVVACVDEDPTVARQHRPRLKDVSRGRVAELAPRREPDLAVDVETGSLHVPRRVERHVRHGPAVDSQLAEGCAVGADEEAADDRVGNVVLGTPFLEGCGWFERDHSGAHTGAVESRDVERRPPSVRKLSGQGLKARQALRTLAKPEAGSGSRCARSG